MIFEISDTTSTYVIESNNMWCDVIFFWSQWFCVVSSGLDNAILYIRKYVNDIVSVSFVALRPGRDLINIECRIPNLNRINLKYSFIRKVASFGIDLRSIVRPFWCSVCLACLSIYQYWRNHFFRSGFGWSFFVQFEYFRNKIVWKKNYASSAFHLCISQSEC